MNRLLKTQQEYDDAIKKIEKLIYAKPGTKEGDEFEFWALLVEKYEKDHYPISPAPATALEAIRHAMERLNLRQVDLIPYIGSSSKVSEVMCGKRSLSINMIRKLSKGLNIPAEFLLLEAEKVEFDTATISKLRAFPFSEMFKKGYFKDYFEGTYSEAKEKSDEILMSFLGNYDVFNLPLSMTRTDILSSEKKANSGHEESFENLLTAWQIRVMNLAKKENLTAWEEFRLSKDVFNFMVNLSYFDKGPVLAKEFLNKIGIHLVIEQTLDGLDIDGCSFLMEDGRPVIALTLRDDSLEAFWFTLFHEIGHLMLHLKNYATQNNVEGEKLQKSFIDIISELKSTQFEKEAEDFASELFDVKEKIKQANLGINSTDKEIIDFAEQLKISPAIIAGQIRFETKNFSIFQDIIGQKRVRNLFT